MSFVGPFPTAGLIEHLTARVPLAKIIGTAGDLDTALETPPNATPALYVLVDEVAPAGAKYSGQLTIQNCNVTIKVVRLVRNVSGERLGTGARQAADALIRELRAALIGWTPHDAFEGITFVAGRDDKYRGGWLAGQEIFRTSYRIQNQVTP